MPVSRKIDPKNTDHLVPHANRLLAIAGKAAWGMTKMLARVAIRIPGWFIRANKRHLVDGHKKP